jgi:hypothetical protein
MLDAVAPATPTLLLSPDWRTAVASSATMAMAGIGPGTPDVPGGRFSRHAPSAAAGRAAAGGPAWVPPTTTTTTPHTPTHARAHARAPPGCLAPSRLPAAPPARRDDAGHPDGLLYGQAVQLVLRAVPPVAVERRREALRAAAQLALSRGITQVRRPPAAPDRRPAAGRHGSGLGNSSSSAGQRMSVPRPRSGRALPCAALLCAALFCAALCCDAQCCTRAGQVHDMGRMVRPGGPSASWEDLEEVYLPAANSGGLPLRVYTFMPLEDW